MLAEMLIGDLLMIYGGNIIELRIFGSFASKLFLFIVIIALKKVFTNEKIRELSPGHSIHILLVPIGSIYIMNAVFMLAYRTEWQYAEVYSLVSAVILLIVNILIFYIYIKLADDLRIRRMNMVYEQQLDLCERHREETELATLQMRDVRHSMRNHFLSILAYAEKGECERIIRFVNDVMEGGKLRSSGVINTGNIVTEDCCGDRWIVYFTDDSGRKQVGMDDIIAASSFSNKYKGPTSGTDEKVYYYPRTDNSIYRINQDSVDYYIHFCNEDLYELQRHVANRTDIMGKIIGSCLIFAALLILIFG